MCLSSRINLQQWYQGDSTSYEKQIINLLLDHLSAQEKKSFFNFSYHEIPDPSLLKNMDHAVCLFFETLQNREKILVVGDYDVDGITATSLLSRFFQSIQYSFFQPFIPNRFTHGYGLTQTTAEEIVQRKPSLIITVDNGITSVAEVNYLKQHGIQTIITDHHTPIEGKIPDCPVINPRQKDCSFQEKHISGVGVAFLFLVALRRRMRQEKYFTSSLPEPNLAESLDLVALGTIADQVSLTGINRTLVHFGLQKIDKQLQKKTAHEYFYLTAFQEEKNLTVVNSEIIAFQLAPMLNAAGRMSDAMEGVEFLLSANREQAKNMFQKLHSLNKQRRMKEKAMCQLAYKIVEPKQACMIAYHKSFHEGIIGIVASRLVEKFGVPAIVLSKGKDDVLKGSCRSVPNVHILNLLQQCASLLEKFGGHAGAAGFSLRKDNLETFKAQMEAICAQSIISENKMRQQADVELAAFMVTQKLAHALKALEPYGQGNPKPLFLVRKAYLEKPSILANEHYKWQIDKNIEAIYWNGREKLQGQKGYYNIIFSFGENRFRGFISTQLIIQTIESYTG